MVEIIFCHRWPFTYFASVIGYTVGTRADQDDTNRVGKLIDEGVSVDFIDNAFKNPNHEAVVEKARKYDAKYAVCPDVFDEKDLDEVLATAEKLDENEITPIIVPKTEFNKSKIKDGWLLGFSVTSDYGGTNVSYSFFEGYNTHLLGGSIRSQEEAYELLLENGSNVVSVDSNYFFNSASYGNLINNVETIFDGGNYNEKGDDWSETWESRACISLTRYYEFWKKKEKRHKIDTGSIFDY
jgi:hypothetical protein